MYQFYFMKKRIIMKTTSQTKKQTTSAKPAQKKKPAAKTIKQLKPEGLPENKDQLTDHKIKKKYLKSRPICKTTFTLPKDAAPKADTVTIVGDFNGWDRTSTPMKSHKNGTYTVTLDLQKGEYRFRYLINGIKWENDWYADRYLPNAFGCDDSVVII